MKTTKEIIYNTAIAMFRDQGYQNVSLRELCKACGITTGSFYKHFDSKRDLLLQFVQEAFQKELEISHEDIQSVSGSCIETLETRLVRSVVVFTKIGPELAKDFWLADIETGNTIMNIKAMQHHAWISEANTESNELIRLSQLNGEMTRLQTPEELMYQFYSATFGISISWCAGGGQFDLVEEIRKLFRLVFQ